jgi:hypothetical protein
MPSPRSLAALLVGALLVTSAACTDDLDLPESATTTEPTIQPTSTSTTVPREGIPLVVVEQGTTSFPDPYERGQRIGGYGVVLQNPNDNVLAAGVQVTTRLLDANGAVLLTDHALLNGIMPGQRMAVGRTIVEQIAPAASLQVSVNVAGWLPPAAAGELAAQEALTTPEPYGGAVTRFAVRSGWPAVEEGVDVVAVYRDDAGRILSAEATTVDLLPAGDIVVGQIRLLAPIPGLATTEVLVGRGFAAQSTG